METQQKLHNDEKQQWTQRFENEKLQSTQRIENEKLQWTHRIENEEKKTQATIVECSQRLQETQHKQLEALAASDAAHAAVLLTAQKSTLEAEHRVRQEHLEALTSERADRTARFEVEKTQVLNNCITISVYLLWC